VEFFDRLKAGLIQLAQLLPPLFFALVILVAGFVVARMAEKLADAFLGNLQFDRSAERWGVQEAVERTGMHMGPTRVVGKLLFWLVMLVVILLASSALGVQNVNDIFANLVGYIPSVFAAIIVIVFGMLLGEFVRALILASAGGVEGVPTLAKLAKVVVITISSFMALQQLGVAADIVTTAWDGIIPALQTRKFEVVISSMTITPDREKEVSFSIPYYRADMGVVFDKTLHTIATPSDLAGLRVGAQVGTTGEQSAHMIDGVTDVRSYPDIQLAMADLKLGRIDAVVNDFPVCAFYAKDSPTLTVIRILKVKDLDLTQYYGIAMHLEDKQLKAAVDKALQDLAKDGTYDSIYVKWFGGTPDFRPGDQKP